MNNYELIFVSDPGLEMEQTENILQKLQDLIQTSGGIVHRWERWGKRRLAFEIQGKQYGYYVLTNFDLAPSAVAAIDLFIRHNASVLRHLITAVDPERIPEIDEQSVKTLGAHEDEKQAVAVAAIEELVEGPVADVVAGEEIGLTPEATA